jgi:hypothetical protein
MKHEIEKCRYYIFYKYWYEVWLLNKDFVLNKHTILTKLFSNITFRSVCFRKHHIATYEIFRLSSIPWIRLWDSFWRAGFDAKFFNTFRSTRWSSWLRHCATSRMVAGSVPDSVTGICHWHNPCGCAMALGPTQPVTYKCRNVSCGIKAAGASGWQV